MAHQKQKLRWTVSVLPVVHAVHVCTYLLITIRHLAMCDDVISIGYMGFITGSLLVLVFVLALVHANP
jgi:hypothetical protein